MLIKEYRIPLPLSVEEYQIAQLYMIAKKSRDESKGAESGIEILVNEPYENGPGGSGQYTHKIYHIGSHLPGWFKSLLPISRLAVEEKAWNAYPYTKTCYACPLVQRFSLEIETYYFNDGGHQDNVFKLSDSEMRNRTVDLIDIVKDQLTGADYVREEDPKLYVSQKTKRGPLGDSWIEEFSKQCQGKVHPSTNKQAIMTAYKLCKVELQIWGMQSKLENYIHSVGLRKTMLRAHRQAWAWQDEWVDLTMDDIRVLERQTQESLRRKMMGEEDTLDESEEEEPEMYKSVTVKTPVEDVPISSKSSTYTLCEEAPQSVDMMKVLQAEATQAAAVVPPPSYEAVAKLKASKSRSRTSSNTTINSGSFGNKSMDLLASLRVESLMRKHSESDSEDEFFDCDDNDDGLTLTKWSSMEDVHHGEEPHSLTESEVDDSIFAPPFLQRIAAEREKLQSRKLTTKLSMDEIPPGSPTLHAGAPTCQTTVLCLVFHAGSVLDSITDLQTKKSDITTFRGAFESVIRQHYPYMMGHVAIKLVSCPAVCSESLSILTGLSPYSFDTYGTGDNPQMTHDSVPVGAVPLLVTSQPEYSEAITKTAHTANQVYHEFTKSKMGLGFNGQIIAIGDSMGALLAYDALVRSHRCSDEDISIYGDADGRSQLVSSHPRRSFSSSSEGEEVKLDFEVSDFFTFGSPLSMVLAHRKLQSNDKLASLTRPCHQVYNLFHPTDPLAVRMEPLVSASFAAVPPVNVARYAKFPLGDGQPNHLLESIHSYPQAFLDNAGVAVFNTTPHSLRRPSEISVQSGMSGCLENLPLQAINALTQKWWGNKRMDYALYCPESLASFPTNSLPHLFHASYWESADVIAFILRQIGVQDSNAMLNRENKEIRSFCPPNPREKWVKKRTSVKLKNLSANHRANDIIILEGHPIVLKARFMYGPLDMVSLSGEKVDVYIMKDPPAGEWVHVAEDVTDKTGRMTHTVSKEHTLGYGIYPVKIIVRGDHTCVDFYCAVVPPNTECVVFSIDGSFTASVSVTGKDPRVRPGAVDVTRHWQELGYLIIYVTGRPDMQHHRVVTWLAQHNFPHGLVSFADGFSTDFLAHKIDFLKNLVTEHRMIIHAAYGSSKDIAVYNAIEVPQEHTYIIGKASKKQHGMAAILSEGYSEHLTQLMAHGGSRPAHGNARMVIPRGYFGLPGQSAAIRRQRSVKRSTAFPMLTGGEHLVGDHPRESSLSPRLKKSS